MKKNIRKLFVGILLVAMLFSLTAATTFTAHCKAMSWLTVETGTAIQMQVTYQCVLIANPLIGYTVTRYAELPITFDR